MFSCAVYSCPNNSLNNDPSIQYHPFPKSEVSQQWVQACGWQNTPIDPTIGHICSVHFDDTAYNTEIKMVDFVACYSRTLRDDAVPTLYLPQTHIIIKEDSLKLENVKGVLVYTLGPTDENDGITTISLQNNIVERQLFQLPSASSDVKRKTLTEPNESDKYSHIKSYPDLYLLQAHNKSLKRKVEALETEIASLQQTLIATEAKYQKQDNECQQLESRITNRNMFTQQEQKAILSKVFSESQIKILFGKKKIHWSNDDMAVGYTIRHLSNKRCYAYLTKTLNIPLPAVSSIKRWTTKKSRKPESVNKEDDEKQSDLKVDLKN